MRSDGLAKNCTMKKVVGGAQVTLTLSVQVALPPETAMVSCPVVPAEAVRLPLDWKGTAVPEVTPPKI
jgi:hypothetical protein